MAELRAALEELGYSSVRTLLNSGNAVFASDIRSPAKLDANIATAIHARCGVLPPAIVKSAADAALPATCGSSQPADSRRVVPSDDGIFLRTGCFR